MNGQLMANPIRGGAVKRFVQINRGFLRIGWLNLVSYPLAFTTSQVASIVPLFMYYFVSRLVDNSSSVGGDYYTFVVVGLIARQLLDGSLRGFGTLLDREIQEGRLEALLVEPIRWRLLPFGMVQFELLNRIILTMILLLIGLLLGAKIELGGLPGAALVLAVGLASTLAIGILTASIKVLSKRSDPLLTFYSLGASVLSGAFFPLEVLPSWVRVLSYALPETYVIAALRKQLMSQGGALSGIGVSEALLALTVFCVVLYPLSLWLFGRALDYGRRLGLLAGY